MNFDDILDPTPDITPRDIEDYLAQARFPASRDDLIYYAKMSEASQIVVRILQSLPDGIYENMRQLDYTLRSIV